MPTLRRRNPPIYKVSLSEKTSSRGGGSECRFKSRSLITGFAVAEKLIQRAGLES